jgi:hypothetical protein
MRYMEIICYFRTNVVSRLSDHALMGGTKIASVT